jgi:hypothetical protein
VLKGDPQKMLESTYANRGTAKIPRPKPRRLLQRPALGSQAASPDAAKPILRSLARQSPALAFCNLSRPSETAGPYVTRGSQRVGPVNEGQKGRLRCAAPVSNGRPCRFKAPGSTCNSEPGESAGRCQRSTKAGRGATLVWRLNRNLITTRLSCELATRATENWRPAQPPRLP